MGYLVEVRARLKRVGLPKLVPLEDVYQHTGFRSVFAYPPDVADTIMQQGSTQGLQGRTVYSDELFVDFDKDTDDISDLLGALWDDQIHHSVWTTGNRGVHVHIAIEPMLGPMVPQSQQAWVRKNYATADASIYIHSGIVRLPGTTHAKTGLPKQKVQAIKSDNRLEIPMLTPPPALVSTEATRVVGTFHQHLLRTKREGGRRQYVWHLATLAAMEGLDLATACKSIMWWNSRNCYPALPEAVVIERCTSVYRRKTQVK